MADRSTKTARTGDVRGALLSTAADVLERDGVSGLTVRSVAAAAGVAPMGVYNHFESKDGLLLAVVTDGFDRLRDALAWPHALAAREALREVGWQYRRFALEHRVGYQLMFGVGVDRLKDTGVIAEHSEPAFQQLLNAVLAGQHAGTIRQGDPQQLAMTIWAVVHGAVMIETGAAVPPGFDGRAAYDAALDVIEEGLRP